jgi:ATP synthase protein I
VTRDEVNPIKLTPTEKAQLDTRARSDLVKIILAQAGVALSVAIIAGLVAGKSALWSALAGSGAYFLPNLFFALRLFASTFSSKGSGPLAFVLGQMLKVLMVLVLLGLIARFGEDRVQWLAVVVGLIAVLKAYFVVLALTGFGSQKYLR